MAPVNRVQPRFHGSGSGNFVYLQDSWTVERRTQVDMRFAKILRFGGRRADIGVDLFNLLNTNYATGFNETYVFGLDETARPGGWATPRTIYAPRFVRLNFTVNF